MSRLIDADALKQIHGMKDDCAECDKELRGKSKSCEYDRTYTLMDFCGWIDDMPTIEERNTGAWCVTSDGRIACSNCFENPTNRIIINGALVYDMTPIKKRMRYCPNCGAKMVQEGEGHDKG